jgi:hypothetical protein
MNDDTLKINEKNEQERRVVVEAVKELLYS